MLKKTFIIPLLLLVSIHLISCNFIYNYLNTQNIITNEKKVTIKRNTNNYYAKVEIKKINLLKEMYPKNDSRNQVDKNITILKESELPNVPNSILILAAHSGTGEHAYFNEIKNLELKDQIIIYYENYKYYYEVDNKYEELKNGKIHIKKNNNQNQIILTTCSTNDNTKQLIITGILTTKERET